ncbi:MAG TPA: hypothetical protein PKU97_17775, partial [Kofleriaceae bacterium]|nr:hypothetical protein [Kofleriaceae bacterium]
MMPGAICTFHAAKSGLFRWRVAPGGRKPRQACHRSGRGRSREGQDAEALGKTIVLPWAGRAI